MKSEEIVKLNIENAKAEIRKEISKDRLIIFFTRILEDLKKYKNPNFYGRLKEFYRVLYPYSDISNTKKIFLLLKNTNLAKTDGLILDDRERKYIKFILTQFNEKCKFKNRYVAEREIMKFLSALMKRYLPNSSSLIDPFLLGRMISAIGGVKKLAMLPSSTIQLIGAEKALFMHISKNKPCPKHGLLYQASQVRHSRNPGKTARKIANQLALNIKIDYFRYLAR